MHRLKEKMSREIWVVSDTHFNHENIIRYSNRPFDNVHHMNETMVENWNKIVKPEDIVYHLGDVYFSKKPDSTMILSRLNGRKRLILGNHDDGKDKLLLQTFQKILAWRHFKEFGLLLTHVPVHPNALDEKVPVNVHGHMHCNTIGSKFFKNVCVEQINYTPINMELLRVR
jgi:calcineurin-like phosphoesterase family protein